MTKDMTRGTPWKLIVQFALPIMAGNLLQQLYNTADTIIVGNFNSQQALSAVGSCASLTALFTALAIGFSIGAGVLISQYFGANRLEDLRRYASSSIVLMLALGLLMSVLGFLQCGAVSGKISGHAAVASAAGSAVFQNLRGRAGLSVRLQHRGGNSARAGRQPGDALFPARLVGAERRAGPSVCGRVSHGRRRRGNCDGSFAACLMRRGLFLHAQAL